MKTRKFFATGMGLGIVICCALAIAAVPGIFSIVNVSTGYQVAGAAGSSGQALCSDGTYYDTPCNVIDAAFYQTVEANGTAVSPQRATLNLIAGTGINASCVDNSGASRSDCTIAYSSPVSVQKNCMVVSCAGGSTYVDGTTYTNSGTVSVLEEVAYTGTGGCVGADSVIQGFVGGTPVVVNGYDNSCGQSYGKSISFVVPAGSSFSTTITHIDGGGAYSLLSWYEVTLP